MSRYASASQLALSLSTRRSDAAGWDRCRLLAILMPSIRLAAAAPPPPRARSGQGHRLQNASETRLTQQAARTNGQPAVDCSPAGHLLAAAGRFQTASGNSGRSEARPTRRAVGVPADETAGLPQQPGTHRHSNQQRSHARHHNRPPNCWGSAGHGQAPPPAGRNPHHLNLFSSLRTKTAGAPVSTPETSETGRAAPRRRGRHRGKCKTAES